MEFQEVSLPPLPSFPTFHPPFIILTTNPPLSPAGGYDAIWLLVFDPKDCPESELPSTRVEGTWSTYKSLDVSPLLASESIAKGLRVEEMELIAGLKELVNVRGQ